MFVKVEQNPFVSNSFFFNEKLCGEGGVTGGGKNLRFHQFGEVRLEFLCGDEKELNKDHVLECGL